MGAIQYSFNPITVQTLASFYEKGLLNLEPGFQRSSVWQPRDRSKLVDSIVRNYPLPSIFLHRRVENGNLFYDVIDGKQRIESVLMFIGAMRGKRFTAKCQLPSEDKPSLVDWVRLKAKGLQHLITGYSLHSVEVTGEPGDVIDLFVRINSTGKALTRQETRHAKYYSCDLLKRAGQISNKFVHYLRSVGVLSAGQISRMKHVELMCELIVSAHTGDITNKENVLDRLMKADSIKGRDLDRAANSTVAGLNALRKMFPKLGRHVRLTKLSDFYSLAVLIQKFLKENLVLTNHKRNALAWDLLIALSTGVDQVKLSVKGARGIKAGQELYRDYYLTILEGVDEEGHRRRREAILRGLLENLFLKRDPARVFSPEQRRILWNTTAIKRCQNPECGATLTWQNFSIDHVDPWSKGGETALRNAALLCRTCNSKLGNRRKFLKIMAEAA